MPACAGQSSNVLNFKPTLQKEGHIFFCVLQEEGQGEVLSRFWFAPLCSPCSAMDFFFSVCAKKNKI
jgi:hypothetical protein